MFDWNMYVGLEDSSTQVLTINFYFQKSTRAGPSMLVLPTTQDKHYYQSHE